MPPTQVGKTTDFRQIYFSAETPEFVISVGNLYICAVNDKILKNVINSHHDSQCLSSQCTLTTVPHCGRNTHFRQIYFGVPNFNFKNIYMKFE